MYEIYIITNIVNAKQYVGITTNIDLRWRRHKNANEDQYIHRAIKKHGLNNFVFTHFATAFDKESAKFIEKLLIIEHNTLAPNGYNLTEGGEGTSGRVLNQESIEKLRNKNIQTWSNTELRKENGKKISVIKKGVPSTKKGKPSGRKGIPHSAEHSAKIKESLNTLESKKKRSESAKIALNKPEWKAAQSARLKALWAIRKAKKLSKAGEIV
jgi:group I intron endonuclease